MLKMVDVHCTHSYGQDDPSVTDLKSRKWRCLKLAVAPRPLKLRKYKAWAWARNVVETKLANIGSSQQISLMKIVFVFSVCKLEGEWGCFL